jgi:hypothetical protein
MSDFSRSPQEVLQDSQSKGYVGIHIEQGAALLDRDLNLLHDLVAATVRQVVARYIGSGLATGSAGFAIQQLPADRANAQDFLIAAGEGGAAGRILVGGIEVTIPAPIAYTSQPGAPALTTPTAAQPDPRLDTVYLDVFLTEVDGTIDPDLTNSQDVGVQTSVRLRADWVVRVAEGGPSPSPPAGHAFAPLALLSRKRGAASIDATMIADLRQRRLTVSDIEQRLGLVERMLLLPAFVPPPLPQFVPKSGVINQPITINGRNLDVGQLQVRFGDTAARIVGAPSSTQVVARVPPNLTPAGTAVAVRLTLANEAGAAVSDDQFTVLAAPAFADPGGQFSPSHGVAGAQITLNGFNFNATAPQVQFGATAATIIGAPTANQIGVTLPAGRVAARSPARRPGAGVRGGARTHGAQDRQGRRRDHPQRPELQRRAGVGEVRHHERDAVGRPVRDADRGAGAAEHDGGGDVEAGGRHGHHRRRLGDQPHQVHGHRALGGRRWTRTCTRTACIRHRPRR